MEGWLIVRCFVSEVSVDLPLLRQKGVFGLLMKVAGVR